VLQSEYSTLGEYLSGIRNLWPEITRAAVYLHNRTANQSNNWKTPYEVFFTSTRLSQGLVTRSRKPNVSHLRTYGCKAFTLSDDTLRGISKLMRLDPQAWVGYLVGYRSTNIHRVWIPSLSKVITMRDVIFDEKSIFRGEEKELIDNLMHYTIEEIATLVKTMELSPPTTNPENESLYEDDTTTNTVWSSNSLSNSSTGTSSHS
jgi:hypothetical protein